MTAQRTYCNLAEAPLTAHALVDYQDKKGDKPISKK